MKHLSAFLFGVCLLAAATGQADKQADGGALFDEFCSGCHGNNSIVLEDFSGTREGFQQILEGVTEDMPDFYGVFSDEEIDALFEYVTGPEFN